VDFPVKENLINQFMGYEGSITLDEFLNTFGSLDGANKWMLVTFFHSISEKNSVEELIDITKFAKVIERAKPKPDVTKKPNKYQ
jgi:hypothetical protein